MVVTPIPPTSTAFYSDRDRLDTANLIVQVPEDFNVSRVGRRLATHRVGDVVRVDAWVPRLPELQQPPARVPVETVARIHYVPRVPPGAATNRSIGSVFGFIRGSAW